jgi:hypothetical protein
VVARPRRGRGNPQHDRHLAAVASPHSPSVAVPVAPLVVHGRVVAGAQSLLPCPSGSIAVAATAELL